MIDWDKGKAVTFLLESLGELGCFLFRIWLLYLKSEFCLFLQLVTLEISFFRA